MTPSIPLDNIYTADEAAERLRLTNRGVIKLGKAYGLCSRRGRDYLFSEADIQALWEVMREPAKQPKPPTVKVAPARDFWKKKLLAFRPIARSIGARWQSCDSSAVRGRRGRAIRSSEPAPARLNHSSNRASSSSALATLKAIP